MTTPCRALVPTPVGTVAVDSDGSAVTRVAWRVVTDLPADNRTTDPVLAEAIRQIRAYFAGELTEFDLPVDLDRMSDAARASCRRCTGRSPTATRSPTANSRR
ncbi:hypothetical protein [Gordonia sp. SMJS1]|uniref:hypothetical protein n=1 Tax=Gordonia sp. SMJS1 TaxID=3039400 RepID=UPI0024572715|nr:hypothetical protein [Gordonia sp. SMJS1]WGJ83943.1 hypothetical protein QAD21_13995 [Gordonia sp. SMJS1]